MPGTYKQDNRRLIVVQEAFDHVYMRVFIQSDCWESNPSWFWQIMFKFHVGKISRKFAMLIGLEILAEFHEASKQAKQDKFIFWTCGLLTLGYHPCMVKLFCFHP